MKYSVYVKTKKEIEVFDTFDNLEDAYIVSRAMSDGAKDTVKESLVYRIANRFFNYKLMYYYNPFDYIRSKIEEGGCIPVCNLGKHITVWIKAEE